MPIAGCTFAGDAEAPRRDQPVFERRDERPDVAAARGKVEHDIGHALTRPVIGEAAAAAGFENGEPAGRE